jgi:hypothetical protein
MIVFLDIDGVMHPVDRRDGVFSCVNEFERVIRASDADIVISSSWRSDHQIDDLRSRFSSDIAARIIGVTPDHYDGFAAEKYGREKEILHWLLAAGRQGESWVALDDSEWMFSPACGHLLLVDGNLGFDDRAADALSKRLSSSTA